MEFLISTVPTIIVLGVLIIIHEFGHFIACRIAGVGVEKFSVGFGPEVCHWQGKQTRYAISLFPLGGFVKPRGESVSELEKAEPRAGDYLAASLPKRIFIIISGVLMNYFLAFALFVVVGVMGRPVPGTQIGGFVEGYPAAESGLEVGDRIVAVNSHEVADWHELTLALDKVPAEAVSLTVERKGKLVPVIIKPKVMESRNIFGELLKVKRIGILHHEEDFTVKKLGLGSAVKEAWETTFFITVITHKAIFYLIQGKLSLKTLSGPIGIISIAGDAAKLGLPYLLQVAANLSVSLAVINLLPIPALDGGHLLFLLIEGIRRRPLSLQAQEKATQVGFALLLVLMAVVIYNDLVKLEFFDKLGKLFGG